MTNYIVRNETPDELVLRGQEVRGQRDVLRLAPLQRARVRDDPCTMLGASALAARTDQAVAWEPEPIRSSRLLVVAWLAALGTGALLLGSTGYVVTGRAWPLWVAAAVAVLSALAAGYVLWRRPAAPPAKDELHWFELDRARSDGWEYVRDFVIATAQGLSYVVVLVTAIAAPAAAIYYGTELSDVIILRSWHDVHLVRGPEGQHVVVGRVLQMLLLVVVSATPALMFMQFDREKLTTLVDRWLHAIFRLDPTVHTVTDVDAKYGRRVEEFYGASLSTGVGPPRRRLRNQSPVAVTTLLIAVGWIVVLLNEGSGNGDLPTMQELFRPTPTPMTMAFLGAYFLAVQVTLRGYVRGDLKPKTYNVISVRFVTAIVLAWTLEALWGEGSWVLGMSFLAGVVPKTVLRLVQDLVLGLGRQSFPWLRKHVVGDELAEKHPLTELDEVDIYERTRLEEEGITSVQALARHDFIDLILSSRIPVPRLIDWLDQALLIQHIPDDKRLKSLRDIGVRTATDFLRVCDDGEALAELRSSVPGLKVHLLRTVLQRDEWLSYIRNWRDHDGTDCLRRRTYDEKGRCTVETVQGLSGTATAAPPRADVPRPRDDAASERLLLLYQSRGDG